MICKYLGIYFSAEREIKNTLKINSQKFAYNIY
jgi:hypothetical protein